MARSTIGSLWDRGNRNELNRMFEELYSNLGTATSTKNKLDNFLNGSGVVSRAMIADNAIDGGKIADSNVYTRHLVENIIVTNRILNRAVAREKIAIGAVGYSELDESIRRLILEFRDDYSDAMTTENEEWVV